MPSGTSPATSPDHFSKPAGSEPDYTLDCEEPVCDACRDEHRQTSAEQRSPLLLLGGRSSEPPATELDHAVPAWNFQPSWRGHVGPPGGLWWHVRVNAGVTPRSSQCGSTPLSVVGVLGSGWRAQPAR